jgi:flavin reductase (DIM6/NTAB) family NADH-FMN oxidoreductase RutF
MNSYRFRFLSSIGAGNKGGQNERGWKIGDNQRSPYNGNFKDYDVTEVANNRGMYNFLISTVIPRPIALVSSQNHRREVNCAPFSYFNVICHDPPLLSVSINNNVRQRSKKDSLVNIEDTGKHFIHAVSVFHVSIGEFVVNIISEWYLDSANHTSGAFSYGTNEVVLSGLTTLESAIVSPPRIAESAVHFECKVGEGVLVLFPHFLGLGAFYYSFL